MAGLEPLSLARTQRSLTRFSATSPTRTTPNPPRFGVFGYSDPPDKVDFDNAIKLAQGQIILVNSPDSIEGKTRELLISAANQGRDTFQYLVGLTFRDGVGMLKPDWALARHYLSLAKDNYPFKALSACMQFEYGKSYALGVMTAQPAPLHHTLMRKLKLLHWTKPARQAQTYLDASVQSILAQGHAPGLGLREARNAQMVFETAGFYQTGARYLPQNPGRAKALWMTLAEFALTQPTEGLPIKDWPVKAFERFYSDFDQKEGHAEREKLTWADYKTYPMVMVANALASHRELETAQKLLALVSKTGGPLARFEAGKGLLALGYKNEAVETFHSIVNRHNGSLKYTLGAFKQLEALTSDKNKLYALRQSMADYLKSCVMDAAFNKQSRDQAKDEFERLSKLI